MQTTTRILLVEDEADLADLVAYNLRRVGYEVEAVRDGAAALDSAATNPPDLVLLDLMIPQISGLQVAAELRARPRTGAVPIVMMTAKAADADQVGGLRAGADDYITKPFSIAVLLARVDAVLRRVRSGGHARAEAICVGDVQADLATHGVRVGETPVRLTLTEFRLLVALMRRRGSVVDRDELVGAAMGPNVVVTSRTIDVHMAAIRRKLGRAGRMIRTVRGVGFLLDESMVGQETGPDGRSARGMGA